MKVLVVDDDAGIRSSLGAVLRMKGYVVTAVASGTEALEALQREPWQMAIVDLRLPDCSGAEAIQEIKRQSPSTTCILITAYAPTAQELAALQRSGSASFLKPLPLEQLLAMLQRAASVVPGRAEEV